MGGGGEEHAWKGPQRSRQGPRSCFSYVWVGICNGQLLQLVWVVSDSYWRSYALAKPKTPQNTPSGGTFDTLGGISPGILSQTAPFQRVWRDLKVLNTFQSVPWPIPPRLGLCTNPKKVWLCGGGAEKHRFLGGFSGTAWR